MIDVKAVPLWSDPSSSDDESGQSDRVAEFSAPSIDEQNDYCEGITSTELASRLGVTGVQLGRWLSGKTKPMNRHIAAEFANWERRGSGTKTRWYRKQEE